MRPRHCRRARQAPMSMPARGAPPIFNVKTFYPQADTPTAAPTTWKPSSYKLAPTRAAKLAARRAETGRIKPQDAPHGAAKRQPCSGSKRFVSKNQSRAGHTVKLEVQLCHRPPPSLERSGKVGGRRWKLFFGSSSNTKQKRETAVSHGLITFVLQIYVQALNP